MLTVNFLVAEPTKGTWPKAPTLRDKRVGYFSFSDFRGYVKGKSSKYALAPPPFHQPEKRILEKLLQEQSSKL